MSGITISTSSSAQKASPWRQYGLLQNPFPPSGVPSDVDYDAHQPDQVRKLNGWLAASVDESAQQWSPLAISGSIGVGKTHVLRKMERACLDYREQANLGFRVMVSSHTLVGSGMKSLLLSNLLFEALNQPLPSSNLRANAQELPILQAALEEMASSKNAKEVLAGLPDSSPIQKPLHKIAAARNPAETESLVSSFASWLARRNLTRNQLEQLGLSARLENEGQAVRAFAHVCLLAKLVLDFRVWFIFIDQMEDLWRRDVTTGLRRTRFLTDLRTLVDEALEGAPVAITLAWNTEVQVAGKRVEEDIESQLKHDYLAMFSRVRDVVHIPMLPAEHALPFAQAYTEHAHQQYLASSRSGDSKGYREFMQMLERDFTQIHSQVAEYGRRPNGDVVARAWLDALRDWAELLVAERGIPAGEQ